MVPPPPTAGPGAARASSAAAALDVLTDRSLDPIAEMVLTVLAGRGVRADGMVDRSCRLVDVAPTLARLLGLPQRPGVGLNGRPRADAYLARQDGEPIGDLLVDGDRPRHVVGFLLDGCNPNTL